MGKGIGKSVAGHALEPVSLSELIHRQVRVAIETAVHEELRTALGAVPYERSDARRGYRNGTKTRTLTGPTGLVALTVPRATLSAAPVRKNGPRLSCPATNGECRKSTKR
jgi:transposase-like protein